ncbi:MAG: DUF4258 domain-containing protein [Candidatus Micrarchaeaceae archaeon]
MEFGYTDHAEEKIQERKLSKKVIEDTIMLPDTITESIFNRKIAQRQIKNKLLRVVYEEADGVYIIITAYYTEAERYG